ncbi:MAG TPA: molybdopterin molybdotransferase MoeA [Puia sp.]|nr:molybdopterin molybdotransferase MoeA [Puia sp.]
MVSFQEARQLVLAQARSFGTEDRELGDASGRVLAGQVRADRDYPPFPRATMDGYALRFDDLERGIRRFRVVEVLFAGAQPVAPVESGECYKIMTGASVPKEANIVIRREDVQEDGVEVEVGARDPEPWRPFLNIARQGEDLRRGDVVIGKPCRCTAPVMGLLATLGCASVKVARLPRVALVTTGDEVVDPGSPVGAVQIRNSNHYMLQSALLREGITPVGSAHSPDQPDALTATLQDFSGFDVLITTGGVSAGDADHVPQVLERLGVRRLFHKVAMRPGKPGYCGILPGGGIVFGLPGNPFSCLVHFALMIGPYLQACQGLDPASPVGVPISAGRVKRTAFDEFFPVFIGGSPVVAVPVVLNGSGDIRLGREANALARHAADAAELTAGTITECYWM